MRAETAVSTLLNAHVGVAAIVGTRIYGNVATEQALPPLIVLAKHSASREYSLDNQGLALVRARVVLLCVADSYQRLKDLGEQVRLALNLQQGSIGGINVLGIELGLDGEGPDEYDYELREHAQQWIYDVVHTE